MAGDVALAGFDLPGAPLGDLAVAGGGGRVVLSELLLSPRCATRGDAIVLFGLEFA